MTTIQSAQGSDIERLAELWYSGWRDAHVAIVPEALSRVRTLESFRDRLVAGIADVRVALRDGEIAGFVWIKGDELYQFYVSSEARGSGVAALLMRDAEQQFTTKGTSIAWLACAIGNDRAARFYEKCGWHRAATITYQAETSAGPFPIENWRYQKKLTAVR